MRRSSGGDWPGIVFEDVNPVLRAFRRYQHENAIREFRDLDDVVRTHATRRVISAVAHGLPPVTGVPRNRLIQVWRAQVGR